jgi:hypothetical protein
MPGRGDFLVELRGFEPVTSAVQAFARLTVLPLRFCSATAEARR